MRNIFKIAAVMILLSTVLIPFYHVHAINTTTYRLRIVVTPGESLSSYGSAPLTICNDSSGVEAGTLFATGNASSWAFVTPVWGPLGSNTCASTDWTIHVPSSQTTGNYEIVWGTNCHYVATGPTPAPSGPCTATLRYAPPVDMTVTPSMTIGQGRNANITDIASGQYQVASSDRTVNSGDLVLTGDDINAILHMTTSDGQTIDLSINSNALDWYSAAPAPSSPPLASQALDNWLSGFCTGANTYNGACSGGGKPAAPCRPSSPCPSLSNLIEAELAIIHLAELLACTTGAGCTATPFLMLLAEGAIHVLKEAGGPPRRGEEVTVPPQGLVIHKGTEYTAEVLPNGTTTIQVYQGNVTFFDPLSNSTLSMRSGQSLTLPPSPKGGFTEQQLRSDSSTFDPNSANKWWLSIPPSHSPFEPIINAFNNAFNFLNDARIFVLITAVVIVGAVGMLRTRHRRPPLTKTP